MRARTSQFSWALAAAVAAAVVVPDFYESFVNCALILRNVQNLLMAMTKNPTNLLCNSHLVPLLYLDFFSLPI